MISVIETVHRCRNSASCAFRGQGDHRHISARHVFHESVVWRHAAQRLGQFRPSEIGARNVRRSEGPAVVFPRVGSLVLRVEVLARRGWRGDARRSFALAPEMSRKRTIGSLVAEGCFTNSQSPCLRGCLREFHSVEKTRRIGFPFGRRACRSRDCPVPCSRSRSVERVEEPAAHDHERRIAQVGEVRDERHHAPAAVLGDALFGEAEEADVEVVEVELLDAPLGDETLPCTARPGRSLPRG